MSWIVIGLLAAYAFGVFRVILRAELGGHGVFNQEGDDNA